MLTRLTPLLVLALAGSGRAEVGGAVSLGMGYEASRDRSGTAGLSRDSAFATAHAHVRAEAGRDSPLPAGWSAELAYDGVHYPDLHLQDLDRPALTLGARWPVGERVDVRLAVTGAWRQSGDAASRAWETGGSVTLAALLHPRVQLRLIAGHRALLPRGTRPGWTAHGRAVLLLTPWSSSSLALAGGGALGEMQLRSGVDPVVAWSAPDSEEPPSAAPADPGTDRSAISLAPAATVRQDSRMASAELTQVVGAGFTLSAGWLWARVRADPIVSEVHLAWLELAWQF